MDYLQFYHGKLTYHDST